MNSSTKAKKSKQAKRTNRPKQPRFTPEHIEQLPKPRTEGGLLAREIILQALAAEGLNRKARRELRSALRSFSILEEAIEKYMPGLIDSLRSIENYDKRVGATHSMASVLVKQVLGFALRAQSSCDMDERVFADECGASFIYSLIDEVPKECLPHQKTCRDAIALSLNAIDIAELKVALVRSLMSDPAIQSMRQMPQWEVAIDGTQEHSYGRERHCDYCLTRTHNKKKGGEEKGQGQAALPEGEAQPIHSKKKEKEEWTEHYHGVCEAKLIVGGMAISLLSIQMKGSDGSNKQECELSALGKMLACLGFYYPGEQFVLLMDALYVSRPAIDEILHYGYDYIIRYKDACACTIENHFRESPDAVRFEPSLPQKKADCLMPPVSGFANNISFSIASEESALKKLSLAERQQKRRTVNICEYIEYFEDKNGDLWFRGFTYITSLEITKENCIDIIWGGRRRWQIEEVFFLQKCFHGMEHVWSKDRNTNECMNELLQIGYMLIQLVALGLRAAVEAMGLKYVINALLDAVRFGSEAFAYAIAEAEAEYLWAA